MIPYVKQRYAMETLRCDCESKLNNPTIFYIGYPIEIACCDLYTWHIRYQKCMPWFCYIYI